MSGSSQETLPNVWSAFPDVWLWLGGPPSCPLVVGGPLGCPEVAERPSRMSGSGGSPSRMFGSGWESLLEVQEWS